MFKLAAKWFLSVHAWVFSSLFNLSDLMFSVVGIRESVMILWWALSNNFIIICYCPQKYRKINITKSLCAKFGPYIYGNRKWQDYVYIQFEYKSTKQKIKHLLREENR